MRFILYLLFIFFNLLNYYEECGKKEPSAERGRTHLDLFFYGAAYTCASFFSFGGRHTHETKKGFPLLRQQEWESSALLVASMNGSCLGKKTAAENQSVRLYILYCHSVNCRDGIAFPISNST